MYTKTVNGKTKCTTINKTLDIEVKYIQLMSQGNTSCGKGQLLVNPIKR